MDTIFDCFDSNMDGRIDLEESKQSKLVLAVTTVTLTLTCTRILTLTLTLNLTFTLTLTLTPGASALFPECERDVHSASLTHLIHHAR